jgi:hypothetical protein
MLGRMQVFADSWIQQAQRFGLPSELVVIEGNPPSGRPSLADALNWPSSTTQCQIRIVTVHGRLPHSAVPLHQMIAKNVGIRRAIGQFILATNLDIVFSPELMRFLSSRPLGKRSMYRIDRHDVESSIGKQATVEELLDFCQRHILRVHASEGSFDVSRDGFRIPDKDDVIDATSGLRLEKGWYRTETYGQERFRWIATTAEIYIEARQPQRRLVMDLETGPSAGDCPVLLEICDPQGAF